MQRQLQGIDLTCREVTLPDELAKAVTTLRDEMSSNLATADFMTGWTPAHSLSAAEARQTSDFIIYSAFTTVARRPDTTWSCAEALLISDSNRQGSLTSERPGVDIATINEATQPPEVTVAHPQGFCGGATLGGYSAFLRRWGYLSTRR